MSVPDEQTQTPSRIRRLLKSLSLDWLSLIFDVALHLRKYICSNPSGPYEIIDYEATLEIQDTDGKKAMFKKRQRVKFLQNSIIAFEDYAWGDGEILADYKCVPGVVVDKYKEGDRWNVLISLRETKGINDIEEFHIERVETNTYKKEHEWLQTEIRRQTRHLRMNIIFPKKRHCLRATLVQRKSNRTITLGAEHIHLLPDGRQLVSWETDHVPAYDIFTLKWQW